MFKKILKIFLIVLLCICSFFTSIIFIGSICNSCKSQSAKAETTSIDINFSNYGSLNFLPFPYSFSSPYTIYGVTFITNSDGSISVSGSSSGYQYSPQIILVSKSLGFNFSEGLTYYLTSGVSGVFSQFVYTDSSGTTLFRSSVTWDSSFTFEYIYITIPKSIADNGVNFTLYPMVNIGSVSSSYIPPLSILTNNSYREGFRDALSQAVNGVFRDSYVNLVLSYDDGSSLTVSNVSPDYVYNGIVLDSIASQYESKSETIVLDSASVTVFFSEPFEFFVNPIYFVGDSLITDATLVSSSGQRFTGSFEGSSDISSYRSFVLADSSVSSILVSSIEFPKIGRASDLLYDFGLFVISADYLTGFDSGYNDGYSNGRSDGFDLGKSSAESSAYDNGYNDGFNFAIKGQDFSAGSFFTKVLSILDVKLFGFISLGDIFKIVVAVGLVILSLKLFAGG